MSKLDAHIEATAQHAYDQWRAAQAGPEQQAWYQLWRRCDDAAWGLP